MKTGVSDDYRALLRGDISADEYVRRVKAMVDARMLRARKARAAAGSGATG